MKRYVAMAAGCLLVGCVSAPKEAATLLGIDWKLLEVDGKPITTNPDQQPTLLLDSEGGHAAGSGGCNSYNAAFTQDETTLRLSPAMASKRGCAAEVNQLEMAFFQALSKVASQRIDKGQLLLLDGEGKLLMRLGAKQ